MTVREFLEEREHNILSAYAAKSSAAVRNIPEENCCYRTAYQRDRDRIIHSIRLKFILLPVIIIVRE